MFGTVTLTTADRANNQGGDAVRAGNTASVVNEAVGAGWAAEAFYHGLALSAHGIEV